jgi:glycosyltransferase involved in cell wall biosynthesis
MLCARVSQELLSTLYRGHDALLFTSRYEAWGMPVLEGMASGLAVVATNCLGVLTFAQHGVNALLADTQARRLSSS